MVLILLKALTIYMYQEDFDGYSSVSSCILFLDVCFRDSIIPPPLRTIDHNWHW